MQSKSLFIAVAALAVTATGVHAYVGTDVLQQAGLSDEQVSAIGEARDLRVAGDVTAARDVLMEAGITEETLQAIRETVRETRNGHRTEVHEAIEKDDYEAFVEAAEDSPLAAAVNSEEDFELLVEAHELRLTGDYEGARIIMDELGFHPGHGKGDRLGKHHQLSAQLTEEQREALRVARQSNDRETIRAIFSEAGVDFTSRHHNNRGRGL